MFSVGAWPGCLLIDPGDPVSWNGHSQEGRELRACRAQDAVQQDAQPEEESELTLVELIQDLAFRAGAAGD